LLGFVDVFDPVPEPAAHVEYLVDEGHQCEESMHRNSIHPAEEDLLYVVGYIPEGAQSDTPRSKPR
jgi:hypothetical protein